MRSLDGRLIAVTLFKGNTFVGVEEGLITEKAINILPTGYFPKDEGLTPGCFITFLITFLSHINGIKDFPLIDKNFNQTTEIIYLVNE